MRSAKVNSKRVVARTHAQLEGFKSRPGLELGMPIPIEEITALLGKFLEGKSTVDALKKALSAATRAAHELAFDLSRKLNVNIAYGESKYGLKSDEVVALGSTVLLQPRSKSNGTETGTPEIAGGKGGVSLSDATIKVA